MKICLRPVIIIGLLLVMALPTTTLASNDARQLLDTIMRGYGEAELISADYPKNLQPMARIVSLLPRIDVVDNSFANNLRLKIADFVSRMDNTNLPSIENTGLEISANDPVITAAAYFVYDLDNNQVIFSKKPNDQRPIASISKLFTAMVALDNFKTDQKFMMSAAAKTVGSASDLSIGQQFDLFQALTYLHTRSSNDVANQIRISYDGLNYSGAFVALMNQKARTIGLSNTTFQDPSGLSPQNQSSAFDLAKTLAYMQNNYSQLLALSSQPIVIRGNKVLESSNPMRKFSNIWRGGKNGYISASGRTLASVVEYKGRNYIIVALGSDYYDEGKDTWQLLSAIK